MKIYPYEKCKGYTLYGVDWLPIRSLIFYYYDVRDYLTRDTKKFKIIVLRLSQNLSQEDREGYTLIYKDIAKKLQELETLKEELEHEIGTSYDQLRNKQTTSQNGTV